LFHFRNKIEMVTAKTEMCGIVRKWKQCNEAFTSHEIETCGQSLEEIAEAVHSTSRGPEHLPALILLDIVLPKTSGPNVLKALKR